LGVNLPGISRSEFGHYAINAGTSPASIVDQDRRFSTTSMLEAGEWADRAEKNTTAATHKPPRSGLVQLGEA